MATIKNNTMYGMRLQFKGKNAADWDENYVLLAGEVGFEFDTKKFKLGDGTKKWSELDYYSEPVIQAAVDALTSRVGTVEQNIQNLSDRVTALEGVNVISGNDAPAEEPSGD